MALFDRFGELDSAADLNELAVNLRKEKDMDSIRVLAKENGIDKDIAEYFIEGDMLYITSVDFAALGKLEVEAAELKPTEIMEDWYEYIKSCCMESEEMALAIRRKGKSLKGCIAALLKWSFGNQIPIESDILKAAGVTAGRVTLGIPGNGRAKKIITDYYLGK